MSVLKPGRTEWLSMPQFEAMADYQKTEIHGWMSVIFLSLILSFSSAFASGEESHTHEHNSTAVAEESPLTNTVCPVMIGNKVDPQISSVYQGKTVFFCCLSCKSAFEKDPEKYLTRLPQFSHVSEKACHDHHGHSMQLTLSKFVKPVGINTLTLIILTVLAALFRRKNPKLLLKWHKRLGVAALVFALVHATLVLITH
ncbi:MAG: YHS domain-containing protein [Planctomycetota bacterium]|jgi:YHS domain-containing protein